MAGSPALNGFEWRSAAWQRHLNRIMFSGRGIQYLDIGQGPVVVLVHGLASAWPVWFRNISELAAEHRVIAVDLPGFGGSDNFGGRVEIDHYVDALIQLLNRLEVRRVQMIGHSLGGIIAGQFAAQHPSRTEALVLVATGVSPRRQQVLLLRGLAAGIVLLNRGGLPLFGVAVRVAMAAAPVRRFLLRPIIHDSAAVSRELATDMMTGAVNSPGATAALKATLRAVRQRDLRAVACPTLIVGGACDRMAPAASLDHLASVIRGARKEVIADAGHHPMFERPEAFNALVRGFFEDVRQSHEQKRDAVY
jgi:pimeloyl-ACP methyl ester carboxylesterase